MEEKILQHRNGPIAHIIFNQQLAASSKKTMKLVKDFLDLNIVKTY